MKNDRKMRLPFLDSQTGVAQSHTDLWHSYRHRRPGKYPGQIYSYPERRWKKKRHYFLFPEERNNKTGDIETGEADMHQISTVENPAATSKADEEIPDLKSETSKDKWYDEYDEYMEPPDAGEMCDDQEVLCPDDNQRIKAKLALKLLRGEDGKVQNSNYCDFCLGDSDENKKTGESEQLVSCSDCGRSGHPTCLQFTANMTVSVKKYPWQCIECKSCGLCGTSENDEQLLFCDDCDRGYHMYCLNPPLAEAPEVCAGIFIQHFLNHNLHFITDLYFIISNNTVCLCT
ncbi:DPF1-like protein [Mya arenaria]|uniref:DPF1-like protein n=1 Tax=Mya arenaria TaxID=6604 RepID=A0ABY7FXY1_MYAAR|nr:DPF1-like protein [Mya arenaria]